MGDVVLFHCAGYLCTALCLNYVICRTWFSFIIVLIGRQDDLEEDFVCPAWYFRYCKAATVLQQTTATALSLFYAQQTCKVVVAVRIR